MERDPAPHPSQTEVTVLGPLLDAFVGRQPEVAEVRRLLDGGARLITLTGPPGVGKTRLALEVLPLVRRAYPDGAFVVPLAQIDDQSLVPAAIAGALGLAHVEGGYGTGNHDGAALAHAIGGRRVLLLLDNLEHLLSARSVSSDGAPCFLTDVVQQIITTCPRVSVLATSRAPLRLSSEYQFAVPPLSVPVDGRMHGLEEVASSDAVHLLVARAQAVRPTFSLGPHNAGDVAALCRALDGIPLAIELAAARVRVLSPGAMLRQIDDRLAMLTGGPLDAPPRQRSLRAAIEWSYRLLTHEEQHLFRRLAVFAGSFDAPAAFAVSALEASDAGSSPQEPDARVPPRFVDLLQSLSQHSLLAAGPSDGRLSMLELIREFALEQLHESGEWDDLRWRHASYYAALAARAEPLLRSADQTEWLLRLEADLANVRTALTWLLNRARTPAADPVPGGDIDADAVLECGLRLAGALWWFWHLRSRVFEGREWLDALLALPTSSSAPASSATRARALYGAGFLAWSCGFWRWDPRNRDRARTYQREALERFRTLGDRRGEGYALWGLALAHDGTDRERQQDLFREGLEAFREVGDLWGIVKSLEHLGDRGPRHLALGRWEEALPVARELDEPQCLLTILRLLGLRALDAGDAGTARVFLEETESIIKTSALLSPMSITYMALGHLRLREAEPTAAVEHFVHAFRAAQQLGSRRYTWEALFGLATAMAGNSPEHALRIAGASAGYWHPSPMDTGGPGRVLQEFLQFVEPWSRWISRGREMLGAERTDQLLRDGFIAPLDRTLEPALASVNAGRHAPLPPPTRASALPSPSLLTPREEETAALIARGLTNREIASTLTITERTVMRHVEHILSKLSLRSRTQIAVWHLERHRSLASEMKAAVTPA